MEIGIEICSLAGDCVKILFPALPFMEVDAHFGAMADLEDAIVAFAGVLLCYASPLTKADAP